MHGSPFAHSKTIKEFSVGSNNGKYMALDGVLYTKYTWYEPEGLGLLAYPIAKEDSTFIMPQNVVSMDRYAMEYNHLKYIELSPRIDGLYNLNYENLNQTIIVPCVTPPQLYDAYWTALGPSITIPCNTIDEYMANSNWKTINSYNEKAFIYVECDTIFGTVSVNNKISHCGDVVIISALPKENYAFVKWNDGNTEPTRMVEAQGVDIYTALFKQVEYSGICGAEGDGTHLQWSLNIEDSVLLITGHGRMLDFDANNKAPWYMLRKVINAISLPEPLTHLGGRAFTGCSNLKTITIPNSVTSIGVGTFYECIGLTSVTIPNSVTSIGDYAFEYCSNLTSIEIPNSVISIGYAAFAYCSGLISITCEATTPPTCGEYVFFNVNTSIPLYVPAQSIAAYHAADQWKDFTNILPIGAQPVDVTTTTVTASETTADIAWPQVNGAATYTIEIKKNGELICTLTFDAEGNLISMSFTAPARDNAPQQTQAAGFAFTVTGLDSGTIYSYTMTAKGNGGNVLKTESGTFITAGEPQGLDEISSSLQGGDRGRLILRNGQIFILRGEKVYTVTGQVVK